MQIIWIRILFNLVPFYFTKDICSYLIGHGYLSVGHLPVSAALYEHHRNFYEPSNAGFEFLSDAFVPLAA